MPVEFVHLRLHSEYSLVDSLIRIGSLGEAVAGAGMPAMAITEHANPFNSVTCRSASPAATRSLNTL